MWNNLIGHSLRAPTISTGCETCTSRDLTALLEWTAFPLYIPPWFVGGVCRTIADQAGFPVISVTDLATQLQSEHTRVCQTALIHLILSTPLALPLRLVSSLHDFNLRFKLRIRHDGMCGTPLSAQILETVITHSDVHLPPRNLLARC